MPSLLQFIAASIGMTPPLFIAAEDIPRAAAPQPEARPVRSKRIGASGTGNSAGYIYDNDPNAELRGSQWYGSNGNAGVAQKMMRDPHVRQSGRYVADPLGGASWRFETKGKRPIDQEAADFCTWAFIEAPFWDRYREKAIMNYVSCGFDLHEMTDDLRPAPADRFPLHINPAAAIAPTGLHEIPPNTVATWHPSKSNPNQLDHVTQWVPYSDVEGVGSRDIPADRLVRLTYAQEGANFAGLAPWRSAYGAWKLKTAFQTILAILHERCGVPVPSITLSENPEDEDIETAELILSEMRSNPRGFLVLPNGSTFEWEQATADDAENLEQAITRCNIDIAYNASAAFMTLGIATASGSNALSGTQQGQYHLSVQSHAKFFAGGLNHGPDGWSAVERVVRMNYGPDVTVPYLVAHNLPTHPWQELAKVAINAISARAITSDDPTEQRIREWLQLPAHDPKTARKPEVATGFGAPVKSDVEDDTADPPQEHRETTADDPEEVDNADA